MIPIVGAGGAGRGCDRFGVVAVFAGVQDQADAGPGEAAGGGGADAGGGAGDEDDAFRAWHCGLLCCG